MPFTPMDAAAYRALTDEAFEKRFAEVKDLMNAEALPEGVTDDMLFAEAEVIQADMERRNKRNSFSGLAYAAPKPEAIEERNAKAASVLAGEGNVVDTTAKVEQKRGFQHVREGNFTDSIEYRQALANFFTRTAPMPADMLAKAYAEYRTNNPVTLNEGYSNLTDPTFTNTYSTAVPLPITLSNEIAVEMHNYGGLYEKVNHTNYPGGYVVTESDMVGEAVWINDKQTSPWHPDYDPQAFSFSAYQLEYRHARSLLAQAMMSDSFKNILAPQIAQEYSRQLNIAVYKGTGTGQPTGITTDARLIDATNGKATIIEASADDLADWSFWTGILYSAGYNGFYRSVGEWIMGDGTWGKYILGLKDANKRPIANFISTGAAINEAVTPMLNTRPVNLLDAAVLPGFDEAAVGDIFAVFGNPRNYTVNTQPGMPLSTVSWDDHDNNLHKTKVIMACDGRVTNPFGWLFLKKKAGA